MIFIYENGAEIIKRKKWEMSITIRTQEHKIKGEVLRVTKDFMATPRLL